MNRHMKTSAAKMLTALLFSLFAMLVSGAPADNDECRLLKGIKEHAESWIQNSTNLDMYVEDLKEKDENDVQCKIKTLCKAEKILSGHFSRTNKTIRALAAYKNHHNKACNGTQIENLADEKKVKYFLEDILKCVQVLYPNCPRVHTPQQ